MKHRVVIEIEVPDDFPDLCWTAPGSGPQVAYDLLLAPAFRDLSRQIGRLATFPELFQGETKDLVEASLERRMRIIEAVTIDGVGGVFVRAGEDV